MSSRPRGITPTGKARAARTGASLDDSTAAASSRAASPRSRGSRDGNAAADESTGFRREEQTEALLRQLLDEVHELKAERGRRDAGEAHGERAGPARPKPNRSPTREAAAADAKSPWVRLHSPAQARYFYLNVDSREVAWEATPCSGGWECFALPNRPEKVRRKKTARPSPLLLATS